MALGLALVSTQLISDEEATFTEPLAQEEVMSSDYEPPPQSEIESELTQAEEDFQTAKKMFNPWYTGPLITGSAENVPPGDGVVQPYFYVIDTFAEYDSHRNSQNIPNIVTVNPVYLFQTGIFSWLDTTFIQSTLFNHQSGEWDSNIGDTEWGLGIQLYTETPYIPGFRLTITEIFPMGKYEKLDPSKNGLDATGSGSYKTTLGLNIGKVIWWLNPLHPMQLRFNFNYTITTPTTVLDHNAYGGGFGTDGKVKPGNTINANFGIQYSFTQRWVAALDLVYDYTNSSNFSGNRGVNSDGTPASVGSPSSDQFSLAPALEYNPNDTSGFVGGVWFTATGRNSSRFASLVLSYYALF